MKVIVVSLVEINGGVETSSVLAVCTNKEVVARIVQEYGDSISAAFEENEYDEYRSLAAESWIAIEEIEVDECQIL